MRKRLVSLLVTLVFTTALSSLAAMSQTDVFGVYFDTAGTQNVLSGMPAYTPFNAYLLLHNPGGAATDGFECTVTVSGAPFFRLAETFPVSTIDVDANPWGYAVGAAVPYPTNSGATLLCTWQLMLQATTPLEFRIGAAASPTLPGGLPVACGNGIYRLGEVSSGDVNQPVAVVNGAIVTPTLLAFTLDVTATTSGRAGSTVRAGVAIGATDGFDGGVDLPTPTPPPSDYVSASFEHADWPMGPRFASDIRARFNSEEELRTWPLLVETDRFGQVVLSFAPSFSSDASVGLRLKDLQTGQHHDLFPELTYVFQNDGLPNSYRFEIQVGVAAPPPALDPPSHDLPAGWSLVGLPLVPGAGATLGTLLLDPAPGYAYVFDYTRVTGYRNLAAATSPSQGTGYWLATDAAFSWTMSGTRDVNGVTIPLTSGWNLIGNANWFPGPYEGLRVVLGDMTYDWLAAAQMGLVSADVQSYDSGTGDYVDTVDLQPWCGYWINALQDGLVLQFHYVNFLSMPKRLTTPRSDVAPVDGSWRLDFTLTDVTGGQRSVTCGQESGATAGFDACYDRPLPPASPAGGPRLQFHRPEWQLAAGSAISRDLVGSSDSDLAWTIVATSSNAGRAVLGWEARDWPAGKDLQLYLPSEDRVVVPSLRETSSHELNLGARAVTFVLRTPARTSVVPSVTSDVAALSAAPNPFNPQTVLSFNLATASHAEVRVYSLRGELVAVLDGGPESAGLQQLRWNGTDRTGHDVPSGSYFARLYVDGNVQSGMTKLCLVR